MTYLDKVRELNWAEQEEAKRIAEERLIYDEFGERPTKKSVSKREQPIWTPLSAILSLLLLVSLAVSGSHLWLYNGIIVAEKMGYETPAPNETWWMISHQWGYIIMAEAALILFLIQWGLSRYYNNRYEESLEKWQQLVDQYESGNISADDVPQKPSRNPLAVDRFSQIMFLVLAISALLLIVFANLDFFWAARMINFLPAMYTAGIGFILKSDFMIWFRRRWKVHVDYIEALDKWVESTKNIRRHERWDEYKMIAIWNVAEKNVDGITGSESPAFRLAYVEREMDKDRWAINPGLFRQQNVYNQNDVEEQDAFSREVSRIQIIKKGRENIYQWKSPFTGSVIENKDEERVKRIIKSQITRHENEQPPVETQDAHNSENTMMAIGGFSNGKSTNGNNRQKADYSDSNGFS